MTAITCIQIGYTNNLYNNYKKKEIIMINNHLLIAIDEELHLRKLVPKSTDKRLITYKRLEDMTPQERDSLLKITKPGDTINIDQARTQNIGTSVGEMIGQLRQDMAFSEGNPLNLDTLNHIFSDSIPPKFSLSYRTI